MCICTHVLLQPTDIAITSMFTILSQWTPSYTMAHPLWAVTPGQRDTRSPQSHLDDKLTLDGDLGILSLSFLMLWNFILSLNESSHFPTFLAEIWPFYASGRFGNVACCLNFPNYVFNWTHYYTYANCFPLQFAIFREWLMEMVCIFLYYVLWYFIFYINFFNFVCTTGRHILNWRT